MEEYPEELRTPPVTLACLVGLPELHQSISAFLLAEQPPMNTLALPDFAKLSIIARKNKEAADKEAQGVLKREWLIKHRTRVPAVVAALFRTDRLEGDPVQWQQVCTDLDSVKALIRSRNIKLVVVLVQTSMRDVSEDLITAIKKRAEIDLKYIIMFVPKDGLEQRQSLNRIASAFAELSNLHYREEGRRVKARIDKKNFNFMELNIRYCFKAAIYAEFRRDWAEASRFYEDGYRLLRELVGISMRLPPVQRLIEIKTVAEQFHFKMSTLLLHGGKVSEAVTWFRKHLASYEQLIGELEVAFLHWEWLSRQYLVFAELLETSSASLPSTTSQFGTSDNPLTEWEFQPAYYYQLSAQYLRKKRESLSYSLSFSDVTELGSTESIISSEYVGQFARLFEEGDTSLTLPLVDAEYTRYALSEGKRFHDSFEIIALFRKSLEYFNSVKSTRMASYCTIRMAKEHFTLSEFGNAKQLLDAVVGQYRHEGWVSLLWEILGYLRECSRKLKLPKDFIEYSLEMSMLPIYALDGMQILNADEVCGPAGIPSLFQRQIIQEEVFKLLRQDLSSSSDVFDFSLKEDEVLHLEIDPISPLRPAFLAAVAFHELSVKPGVPTLLTLAILTHLPNSVEIDQLEIQFNQAECNFVVGNNLMNLRKGSVLETSANSSASINHDGSVDNIPLVLTLETNKWTCLTCEVKPEQSGKLECISMIMKLSRCLSVCCRAESTASMEELPLWKFEIRRLSFPTEDPILSYSGQKFIQVEEPDPQVDLILNASSPALVGERFTVPVTVLSKSHVVNLGELKINIVDARGGGLMSPRETETFSFDNNYVELLGISGMAEEDASPKDIDSIKKVTPSFGLVSVPFLEVGDSWEGKIEIKWHKPKSVMLYVSLGYSPDGSETSQIKINVHKSLQIEGKIPIVVNHRFMLPFRREPLLPPKVKQDQDSSELQSLALDETSILVVSTRNCCEVPLRLICVSIDQDNSESASVCTVSGVCGTSSEPALLLPGVEFKQIFSVYPHLESQKLEMGCISIEWRRDSQLDHEPESCVVTKQKLPDVRVQRPPLIVSWECPPQAVVGVPFMFYVKLKNLTSFLQDVKFSLGDSQSFVFCGSHSDSASILPKAEHIVPFKLVPLSSGHQQLPQFTLTSVRYSAGFHPSAAASTIFVFPSEPSFHPKGDSTPEHNTTIVDVA